MAGLEACADDLRADGIHSVELPVAHMDSELDEIDEDFWDTMRDTFARRDVSVASIHGPVFSFDRYELGVECDRLRAYARAAVRLGARALVVHPVLHASLHVCNIARAAMRRDIALSTAICSELEGTCCRLAIENVPHNSWAYLRELFRRLPPSAGMCFDTGHFHVRPECSLSQAVGDFCDRIVCWHLSDNDGLCDAHLAPGAGTIDWKAWRSAASKNSAPRVLELSLPMRSEDPKAREVNREATRAAIHLASGHIA